MLEELYSYCALYGYLVKEDFGLVFIHTRFEYWYIDLDKSTSKKIYLMHQSMKDGTWHKQFCKEITVGDLIQYIHKHEQFKYIGRVSKK